MSNKNNKVLFNNHDLHGIHSFKLRYNNLPADLKSLIGDMKKECINRLKSGMTDHTNPNAGISVAIESPTCCPNYAELNLDRSVPLRQYFGRNDGEEVDGIISRWSYGLGSGSTTVGGDLQTTTTRPLTLTMKKMCDELQKLSELNQTNTNFEFNHVTILYYLTDNDCHKTIELKKHCDVEITPTNKYKENNSQKYGTPTVVLSLLYSKTVKFFKRYVTDQGRSFNQNDISVGGMFMEDGDLFYLSPEDEFVIQREVMKTENGERALIKEKQASNFRHAVRCSINDVDTEKMREDRISISVCFRQTVVKKKYHVLTDTVMDVEKKEQEETEELELNNKDQRNKLNKQKLIEKKRGDLSYGKNRERINKRLKRYHLCALKFTNKANK